MLVRCSEKDKHKLLEYIGKDYYKCLYLYIDLIKYGAESGIVTTWILYERGKITALFLSYHTALHIYSHNNKFKISEFVELVNSVNPSIICASAGIINYLTSSMEKLGFIAEIGYVGKFNSCSCECQNSTEISRASREDFAEIARLLYEDDDIGASYDFDDLLAQMRERDEQGFSRSYVFKHEGKVVAHMSTGGETGNVATINYVITDADYRGQGLATKLFGFVCNELYKEGKEVYSIYYVENSRRLHHKIGFEDCCQYGKLFLNKH